METINAFANIFGNTGYAVHARNFFRALNQLTPVCLAPKFGAPVAFGADDPIFEMLQRLKNIDLRATSINLDEPEEMYRFCGGRRIGYTVFETDLLSAPAIHQLKQLDSIWVPTRWGQGVLEKNGIPSSLVQIVPEGVDPEVYRPELSPYPELTRLDGFRFLAVGKWETRKGLKELLTAFDQAFTPSDRVFLVVYFLSEVRALQNINVRTEIDRLNLKMREKIVIIESPLASDRDMARLYNSCHAFVSASKAEGWGLPLLEAMACGLPAIAPFYSGPTEFLEENDAYPLPVTEFEDVYCPVFFPEKGAFGRWAVVDPRLLADKMRFLFLHPDEAREKGRKAAQRVQRQWTWENAARKAFSIIQIPSVGSGTTPCTPGKQP